ncbi:MAG: universal stress protein, partial [Candidatus Binataceae bacterium]
VLEEFAESARREALPVETALDMGIVANQLCERAKSADLVAIGHRGVNEKFSTGLLGSTAESVARKCPRPLFISPMKFREMHRPVLAYDGSERSARAMRQAAEFASVFETPLTVITVARDPRLGERTLDEARTYLDSYPPKAEYRLIAGHAHEEIVKFLKERDADLLFIGAYGHSRIIEMVLGSTTEYVLRNSPCPVFLMR